MGGFRLQFHSLVEGICKPVGRCVEPLAMTTSAWMGHSCTISHSQREEIFPLPVQDLPFLFPCGEAVIDWGKTKGMDTSDGCKVTLLENVEMSYSKDFQLLIRVPWVCKTELKQKVEDWELEIASSLNMERFILYGSDTGKLLFLT